VCAFIAMVSERLRLYCVSQKKLHKYAINLLLYLLDYGVFPSQTDKWYLVQEEIGRRSYVAGGWQVPSMRMWSSWMIGRVYVLLPDHRMLVPCSAGTRLNDDPIDQAMNGTTRRAPFRHEWQHPADSASATKNSGS
jgi:hypothetical protein